MAAFYRTAAALLVAACLGLTVADLPACAADVPPTASLPSIFNGRDLTGWKVPQMITDVNTGDVMLGGIVYPSRGFTLAGGNKVLADLSDVRVIGNSSTNEPHSCGLRKAVFDCR